MGQSEVLDFLNDCRIYTDRYFTVKQIQKGLMDKGLDGNIKGVYRMVLRLVIHNEIEWKGRGFWNHHKEFRGKTDGK